MKKLILIAILIAVTSCSDIFGIDDCQCEKETYEIINLPDFIGLQVVEFISTETVPCQDEKTWKTEKYKYVIKCK